MSANNDRSTRRQAVTLQEAALRMGVCYETVRRLAATNRIAHFRAGRSVRILETVLVRYMKAYQSRADD